MTKKKVQEEVKATRKETRNIEVGTTGCSTLSVTVLDKYRWSNMAWLAIGI